MNALPLPAAGSPAVDDRNPWLGLASFTEEAREYFYGRDAEVGELARRVQRKLLTILFGQSGLGKTSILRAGLVPKLRGHGYCPVYVRIDYSRESPDPSEQIKQAIAETARRSGQWTRAGVAVAGESLWEFLHHRDDLLLDASGATLIPLLIFDQFEEIFTLAQTDDFGRARAAAFIADLADLVENRPPRDLERRLEQDDSTADRFDFARSDYRVLIALREDYLAPLEGLKGVMPSVTQNRLRLAPMTGSQALAAVLQPGKGLVSEDVGAAIVRFVAGGAELANAEVEPSLLSLICRELNDARLSQGRPEISLDLLEGSHESILGNFYERCLADQPVAVRRVIEDELLTESGFRENVAEEKLASSLARAGAAPDTLPVLVNRRLLRIEERLDIRRVELTHDVLCGVVKASRQVRQEREAREASERQLTEQRERARADRASLLRARKIAAICTGLAVLAVLAAIFAYISTQRAHRAERLAQETRRTGEQARIQAEQLLAFLTDDFARELEATGRLDVVRQLSKRQVDYFNALPPSLKGPDTRRNGALAMVQYSSASRRMGKLQDAKQLSQQAINILSELTNQGDRSEATRLGLALALDTQASAMFDLGEPGTVPISRKAMDILTPLIKSPDASLAARRAYLEAANTLGYLLMRTESFPDAVTVLREGMRVASQTGAGELKYPDVSAQYAYLGGWLIEALGSLDRNSEAHQVATEAQAVADRLVEKRPNDVVGLKAQQLIAANIGYLDMRQMHAAEAVGDAARAVRPSETLLRLDPENEIARFNLAVDIQLLSDAQWALGETDASVDSMRRTLGVFLGHTYGPRTIGFFTYQSALAAQRLAETGDMAAAAPVIAEMRRQIDKLRTEMPATYYGIATAVCREINIRMDVALRTGKPEETARLAGQCLEMLSGVKPDDDFANRIIRTNQYYIAAEAGQARYMLGDLPGAEKFLRDAIASRNPVPVIDDGERRERSSAPVLLTVVLGREGRYAEAQQLIKPIAELYQRLAKLNKDDQTFYVEQASVLYAQAVAGSPDRERLLTEARSLIGKVSPRMKRVWSVKWWQTQIDGGAASRSG